MCSVWCRNFFGSGFKDEFLNTALQSGGASKDQCADPSTLTSEVMTLTWNDADDSRSGTFNDASGAPQLMVTTVKKSMSFDPVHVIRDGAGEKVLAVVRSKTGMTQDVHRIYRATPSFEGQEPLTGESHAFADYELDAIGLGDTCYQWAQVDTKRGFSEGHNTFKLVGAQAGDPALYLGHKFSAVSFYAQVTTSEGAVVAKAQFGAGRCNTTPVVDVAAGVDLLAVLCSCLYLVGGGGSAAGAMAGAGVV